MLDPKQGPDPKLTEKNDTDPDADPKKIILHPQHCFLHTLVHALPMQVGCVAVEVTAHCKVLPLK
jgi:hypothetical protein